MPIIKLDAIDSTNDYLKQLAKEQNLENYTIVMAREQTKGRGQMGAKWFSEPGQNLTMSVLVKDLSLELFSIFDLNVAVALAAANTLFANEVAAVNIKWPNDIMADSKKVGGILIENSFKGDGTVTATATVGLGLNLNQTNFEHLPQATSLACVTGRTFDVEKIATLFVEMLKQQLDLLPKSVDKLWTAYDSLLFKKNKPVAFEDNKGSRFMGIIQEVTHEGELAVLLENDSVVHFAVKEVKMLY